MRVCAGDAAWHGEHVGRRASTLLTATPTRFPSAPPGAPPSYMAASDASLQPRAGDWLHSMRLPVVSAAGVEVYGLPPNVTRDKRGLGQLLHVRENKRFGGIGTAEEAEALAAALASDGGEGAGRGAQAVGAKRRRLSPPAGGYAGAGGVAHSHAGSQGPPVHSATATQAPPGSGGLVHARESQDTMVDSGPASLPDSAGSGMGDVAGGHTLADGASAYALTPGEDGGTTAVTAVAPPPPPKRRGRPPKHMTKAAVRAREIAAAQLLAGTALPASSPSGAVNGARTSHLASPRTRDRSSSAEGSVAAGGAAPPPPTSSLLGWIERKLQGHASAAAGSGIAMNTSASAAAATPDVPTRRTRRAVDVSNAVADAFGGWGTVDDALQDASDAMRSIAAHNHALLLQLDQKVGGGRGRGGLGG